MFHQPYLSVLCIMTILIELNFTLLKGWSMFVWCIIQNYLLIDDMFSEQRKLERLWRLKRVVSFCLQLHILSYHSVVAYWLIVKYMLLARGRVKVNDIIYSFSQACYIFRGLMPLNLLAFLDCFTSFIFQCYA